MLLGSRSFEAVGTGHLGETRIDDIKHLESGPYNNIVIFIPGSLFVICNLIILVERIERL
jgi:hypothetical protein